MMENKSRKSNEVAGEVLRITADNKPLSLIVVGGAEAQAAATDLQELLEKSTGVKIPIVKEGNLNATFADGRFSGKNFESLIFVGNGKIAAGLGIDGAKMPPEGYRLRTVGNALFLVGNDINSKTGDKLNGSYFAVTDFLESLGFAFLWPGQVGTAIPKINNLSVKPYDISDAPVISMRIIRNYGPGSTSNPKVAKIWKSFAPEDRGDFIFMDRMLTGMKNQNLQPKIMGKYFPESFKWCSRMRLGGSSIAQGTHSFGGWYERYGKTHPDWFSLRPDGTRIQKPPREQLCFSNPDLINAVIADRISMFRENPKLNFVSISPEDGSVDNFPCMCENCRRLDPVNAAPISTKGVFPNISEYVSMSDRYFTFFSKVTDGINKEYPDRQVVCIAYQTYRNAPLHNDVSPNLTVGFVGFVYDDHQMHSGYLSQWDAWAEKAKKLYLRPNAFHSGHGVLLVYPTELGKDIKHCYQTGMIGVDFDSIIHFWSTQGINYYVLAKLLWDPSQDIDALIDDYCQKGFGPAANEIRNYFRHAEALTSMLADHQPGKTKGALTAEEDDTAVKLKFPIWERIHIYYDQAHLAPLRADLEKARSAAKGNKEILQRIDFLESGLNYTASQAEAFAIFNNMITEPEKISDILQRRNQLFNQLYRDYPFSINIPYICWREGNMFNRYLTPSKKKGKP